MPLFLPTTFVNMPIRPEHQTCLFVLAVIIINDDNNILCFQSVFKQTCCSKAEIAKISCSNHAFIYFTLWNVHFKSTMHMMQWFVKLATCLVLLASKKAQKGQKKCVVFLIYYVISYLHSLLYTFNFTYILQTFTTFQLAIIGSAQNVNHLQTFWPGFSTL